MADYAKRKNDDLIALCKERGLPHTGKKADFVKRLEEYDAQQGGGSGVAAKPAVEDEIDWDDEPAAATATTEPAASAMEAGGVGQVSNPAAVPNQTVVEDPATTETLTVEGNTDATPAEPAKDFTSGIAERTIDEEIEKRKARARKFGLPEDSDEIKALERAKRFGVQDASAVPGLLNQALSEGKKRGLDAPLSDSAGVKKRGGRGGRRGGGRDRSRTPKESRPSGNGTSGGWMSEADRAKAEARKARFAAPAG
jgi:SAP domain-containing ribonucleoprotein